MLLILARLADDASFKSDTYSRQAQVRKAASAHTHTHKQPSDREPGSDAGRHRGSGFRVEVGIGKGAPQRGLVSGGALRCLPPLNPKPYPAPLPVTLEYPVSPVAAQVPLRRLRCESDAAEVQGRV